MLHPMLALEHLPFFEELSVMQGLPLGEWLQDAKRVAKRAAGVEWLVKTEVAAAK